MREKLDSSHGCTAPDPETRTRYFFAGLIGSIGVNLPSPQLAP
jgi:hypothetical protein